MQQVPLSARAASMAPGGYARGRRAATATPDHSHCRSARKASASPRLTASSLRNCRPGPRSARSLTEPFPPWSRRGRHGLITLRHASAGDQVPQARLDWAHQKSDGSFFSAPSRGSGQTCRKCHRPVVNCPSCRGVAGKMCSKCGTTGQTCPTDGKNWRWLHATARALEQALNVSHRVTQGIIIRRDADIDWKRISSPDDYGNKLELSAEHLQRLVPRKCYSAVSPLFAGIVFE